MIKQWPKIRSLMEIRQGRVTIPSHLSNVMLMCFMLSILLVGSCKTSQLSTKLDTQQYGLLPEVKSDAYTPAKGYSYTARHYIAQNPDALLHMTEMQIKYLLGSPGIKWQENPAEIWQYQGKSCTLDVYFYKEDLSDSEFLLSKEKWLAHHRKVSYYELRQLGRPEWARGPSPKNGYLPSKIRTTGRISECINNIVNKT